MSPARRQPGRSARPSVATSVSEWTPREISIANRHPRLRLDRRAIAAVIATLDRDFRFLPGDRPYLTPAACRHSSLGIGHSSFPPAVPAGELSLVFLTDAALAQLHADFLDDPTITDVITFEGQPTLGTAGEICVSADTAAAYARAHGRDFSTELTLYLIHGWLHLAGYDDLQPAKKRRMRAAEARAQRLLAAAGVAPRFVLRK